MPFVPDSRTPGYLGPNVTPQPLFTDPWEDFLHDVVCGITGMPGNLVFTRWQPVPPVRPAETVDWASLGITEANADWQPVVLHVDDGADGYDALSQIETTTVLVTFYGPNNAKYATYLRSGMHIRQNQAALRKADVGFVEVQAFQNVPELFKQRWIDRVDVPIVLRRDIRMHYPVLHLISAQGTITANPYERRTVVTDFDTSLVTKPLPLRTSDGHTVTTTSQHLVTVGAGNG